MTQRISLLIDGDLVQREVPDASAEVTRGVKWGLATQVFTPAYWLIQSWMSVDEMCLTNPFQTKDGLLSEIVFCLLGGYGITAELASAAYKACVCEELISRRNTSQDDWLRVLSMPLTMGTRKVRYRFPNKKSTQLAQAMLTLRSLDLFSANPLELRQILLTVPGVGYKTASWIIRNVYDSDQVAILDIHIHRAGLLCGLFRYADRISTDYLVMEERFLEFSHKLGVRPAILDCVIWEEMRAAGDLPLRLLPQSRGTERRRVLSSQVAA